MNGLFGTANSSAILQSTDGFSGTKWCVRTFPLDNNKSWRKNSYQKMSGLTWPCNFFFSLLLVHLRAATFGACVESSTDSQMSMQTLKPGIKISWQWCWRWQANAVAMVWSRGSTWNHQRGIEWCWETRFTRRQDTAILYPGCATATALSPLSFNISWENDNATLHAAIAASSLASQPDCSQSHCQQLQRAAPHSLSSFWYYLIFF